MASTEPFISSIDIWPLDWAPKGWASCQGQLLAVSSNTALFSLLGTVYGGNGTSTFGLPNMQGRMPLGMGTLNGTFYQIGQIGGSPQVTLQNQNVPLIPHTHTGTGAVSIKASNNPGGTNQPGGMYLAVSPGGDGYTDTPDTDMGPATVTITVNPTGAPASAPVAIMPPYLALNFIIALNGIYPSRQ